MVSRTSLSLTAAYLLDMLFGDPQWFPHPVRFIGMAIDKGETFLRKLIPWEMIAGCFLTMGLISSSWWLTRIILDSLRAYTRAGSAFMEIFLLYVSLSVKDLAVESRWVKNAVSDGDLPLARRRLSWIVGRDTDDLPENEIVRATVETVAENTVDGILSPMFYALLGGAPLAMAYKTINTLDSMIGHKNKKYIKFGKFTALVDRWANYLPARISGLVFPLAAWLTGHSFRGSFRCAWKHQDNSFIPEGAMAGAIGVQLGGDNYYQGTRIQTPLLGEPLRSLTVSRIEDAIRVMYAASLIFIVFGMTASLAFFNFK